MQLTLGKLVRSSKSSKISIINKKYKSYINKGLTSSFRRQLLPMKKKRKKRSFVGTFGTYTSFTGSAMRIPRFAAKSTDFASPSPSGCWLSLASDFTLLDIDFSWFGAYLVCIYDDFIWLGIEFYGLVPASSGSANSSGFFLLNGNIPCSAKTVFSSSFLARWCVFLAFRRIFIARLVGELLGSALTFPPSSATFPV